MSAKWYPSPLHSDGRYSSATLTSSEYWTIAQPFHFLGTRSLCVVRDADGYATSRDSNRIQPHGYQPCPEMGHPPVCAARLQRIVSPQLWLSESCRSPHNAVLIRPDHDVAHDSISDSAPISDWFLQSHQQRIRDLPHGNGGSLIRQSATSSLSLTWVIHPFGKECSTRHLTFQSVLQSQDMSQ